MKQKFEQNEKILRLHKAKKDLEVRNKNLDVAFKTRIEEITKLKTRPQLFKGWITLSTG